MTQRPTRHSRKENQRIADRLREYADMLEEQRASPFRVAAYRHAANTAVHLDRDLRDLFDAGGIDGLEALPRIGKSIAAAIAEMLSTGRWIQLERLRGISDPTVIFQAIPHVGPVLARRIHDRLDVDTLEALEATAFSGQLEAVDGIGRRRAAAIRASVSGQLNRIKPQASVPGDGPPVALLLDVDREYREQAEAGKLETIAPRRFNPEGKKWLPVLHLQRSTWHFTALYSNTARAHELGCTKDWVILYFHRDHDRREFQVSVVTENRGSLLGKRVVRGKEAECRGYYGV